jgi:hypothetical protein
VDSSVSFHMTSHKEWFLKYDNYDGGKVYLEIDSTLQIVSLGRVKIQSPNGRIKGVDGVIHILGLAQNLLFARNSNDIRVQVSFSSSGDKMNRGSMMLAWGARIGTLYKFDAHDIQCNSVFGNSSKVAL